MEAPMLNKIMTFILVLAAFPLLAAEVDGTSSDSVKACVRNLVDAELAKNDATGIQIKEIKKSLMPTSKEYHFKGIGQDGVRYSGFIAAEVNTGSLKTTCKVADNIVFDARVCRLGCEVLTFELNAQLLRYSGSKALSFYED